MDTEGGVAAVVGADVPAVQQNFGAGIDALELQPDFLRSCVEHRSGKGGAVGAGAAPVIVAAVLAVFCVPSVGQLHQSGLAVRPGELPVLHELGDASHSFSSRVSVAFSLLCGRFSVFRYYFIKDFSFRKTVAIIGRMVWIFGFALTNRSRYICASLTNSWIQRESNESLRDNKKASPFGRGGNACIDGEGKPVVKVSRYSDEQKPLAEGEHRCALCSLSAALPSQALTRQLSQRESHYERALGKIIFTAKNPFWLSVVRVPLYF